VIAGVLTDDSDRTGVYYDEKGRPMNGSTLVREPEFTERVVAETRALLAKVPA
jgi:galactose-1-phosphate uridylyltransferase